MYKNGMMTQTKKHRRPQQQNVCVWGRQRVYDIEERATIALLIAIKPVVGVLCVLSGRAAGGVYEWVTCTYVAWCLSQGLFCFKPPSFHSFDFILKPSFYPLKIQSKNLRHNERMSAYSTHDCVNLWWVNVVLLTFEWETEQRRGLCAYNRFFLFLKGESTAALLRCANGSCS